MDSEKTGFKRQFRGYSRDQVDASIGRAAGEIAGLKSEIEALKRSLAEAQAGLEKYRTKESSMTEALMSAAQAAEETRANAHQEADAIMQDAKHRAAEVVQSHKGAIAELRFELEKLRLEKQRFITNFRTLLESHLNQMTEVERFAVVDGDVAPESSDAAQA